MKCNIVVNIDYTKVIIDNQSDWCTAPKSLFVDVNSTVSIPLVFLEGADETCVATSVGTIVGGGALVIDVGTDIVRVTLTNAKIQVNVESHVPYHVTDITPTRQYVTPGQSAQVEMTYSEGYTASDLQATIGTITNHTLVIPTNASSAYVTTTVFRGSKENINLGVSSTTTDWYLPTTDFYRHAITQQLYLSNEMGNSGTIRTISFKHTSDDDFNRSIAIYMENVTDTSISAFTDVTNAQKVFDGVVTFVHADWTTIILSNPFEYDNTKNLKITVYDNTGSVTGPKNFIVYQRVGNSNYEARYDRRDSPAYDITQITTYGGTASVRKSSIKIYKQDEIEDTPDPEPVQEPTIIEIGSITGATTKNNIPIRINYSYSMSEQIYLSSEIGMNGTITDIAYHYADSTTFTRTLDIYLVHTSLPKFRNTNAGTGYDPSTDEIIHPTANDLVFSGSVNFAKGWVTIHLDTPFEYDGEHNLCVLVYDHTGSSSSSSRKFTVNAMTTDTWMEWHKYESAVLNPIDSSISSAVMTLYRNIIQLSIVQGE